MPAENFREVGKDTAAPHHAIWTAETFDRLYRMIDYAIRRQDW
jgi:hypothetical protein